MRLYDLLKKMIDDRPYKMFANVTSSSPVTLTLPNSVRGLIHISSVAVARTALYSVVSSTAGVVTIIPIVSASSITVTSSANNQLTISSNATSNAYVAWIGNNSIGVK